jgi:hypothetical protein
MLPLAALIRGGAAHEPRKKGGLGWPSLPPNTQEDARKRTVFIGNTPEGLASHGHSLSGVKGVSTSFFGFLTAFLRPQHPKPWAMVALTPPSCFSFCSSLCCFFLRRACVVWQGRVETGAQRGSTWRAVCGKQKGYDRRIQLVCLPTAKRRRRRRFAVRWAAALRPRALATRESPALLPRTGCQRERERHVRKEGGLFTAARASSRARVRADTHDQDTPPTRPAPASHAPADARPGAGAWRGPFLPQ